MISFLNQFEKKYILTTGEDILQNFILERLKNIIGLT